MADVDHFKYTRPSERFPSGWADDTEQMGQLCVTLKFMPHPYIVRISGKGTRPRSVDWKISQRTGLDYDVFREGKAKTVDEAKAAIDALWPDLLDEIAEIERRTAAYHLRQADAFSARSAELRRPA